MKRYLLTLISFAILSTLILLACTKPEEMSAIGPKQSAHKLSADARQIKTPVTIAYFITDGRNNNFKLRDIPEGIDMVVLFGIKYFHYLDTIKYRAGADFEMMKSYTSYKAYFEDIKILQQRGIKVLQNVDDDASWQKGQLLWREGKQTLSPSDWADSLKKLLIDDYKLDGISLDIEHGGEQILPLPPFPKFEDIGYRGWFSSSMTATPTFLSCIRELTRHFGEKAGLNLELHTASGPDVLSWDPIAENFRDDFTFFQIQSYGMDSTTAAYVMKHITNVNKIRPGKIVFGAWAEQGGVSGRTAALGLARWNPQQGPKGGMMVYTFNTDPDFGKDIMQANENR